MQSDKSTPPILACLQRVLPGVLAQRPVLLAYAYGSVVEGYATALSDVDIALVFAPDHHLDAYGRLMQELEIAAELEALCPTRHADVRSIDAAPLLVQGRVLTQGRLLFSKDEDFRVSFEVTVRKRYFDFQPVQARMREAYFAQLESKLKASVPDA